MVAKRLLQLDETFHDGHTRSRNPSEALNILAIAWHAATVTSQRNPTVEIETGAGTVLSVSTPEGECLIPLAERFVPARRPATLVGVTIGLFWNGKPQGDVGLGRVREQPGHVPLKD